MSRVWSDHARRTNETCDTHMNELWVMSHVWKNYVICMHEAYHTFSWVMSLVTRVSESSHTHTLATFYCVWYDSFSIMCVWHDLFRYVTWLMTHGSWLILLYICMTWLIQIRDVTHNSFVHLTCLIRAHDVTYLYVWHDSIICVTWRIHRCGMTYSYVGRDSWLMAHSCHMHALARVSIVHI